MHKLVNNELPSTFHCNFLKLVSSSISQYATEKSIHFQPRVTKSTSSDQVVICNYGKE